MRFSHVFDKFFRKRVSMVQLGAKPILWKDPSGDTDWSNEAHCDFAVYISKKVFSDDTWSGFIAASRKDIPKMVRSLHPDLNAETCPFFAWRKLDDGTHRASFRAPAKHEKLFLAASGILGPFFIQKLCRTSEQKSQRSQETVVQWLPKKTYADVLALVRSFDAHFGLVFTNDNFGVRVATANVAAARKCFAANDPRYTDSNRGIVGRRRYEALGLPKGCTRSDIITNFAGWKNGWHVLPQKQVFVADGECIWYVLADTAPPDRYYEGKNCRVLLQEVDATVPSSDSRSARPSRAATPVPKRAHATPAQKASSSSTISVFDKRLAELESRMTSYEGRLTDTEKRLTNRIDDGFSQVLSQLQALQAPALPQGSKRSDAPQSTPHKGGPRKDARLES